MVGGVERATNRSKRCQGEFNWNEIGRKLMQPHVNMDNRSVDRRGGQKMGAYSRRAECVEIAGKNAGKVLLDAAA